MSAKPRRPVLTAPRPVPRLVDENRDRFFKIESEIAPEELYKVFRRASPLDYVEFMDVLYEDLDDIFKQLRDSAHQLQGDGEEELRTRVVHGLCNRNYDAVAEVDVRGHVDICVTSKKLKTKWLAEAKRHSSYKKLIEGMKQLHTRYSDGQGRQNMLLIFSFGKNADGVFKKWKETLVTKRVCSLQGTPQDVLERDFTCSSEHRHAGSGLMLTTRHVVVCLHYAPQDQSALGNKSARKVKIKRRRQPSIKIKRKPRR